MRHWTRIGVILLFMPVLASAQYRDLDAAAAGLERGFSQGESKDIINGIAEGDQVMLQFPGLVDESGFFGRDQAAFFLDGLFKKVKPSAFEKTNTRKVSAEGQYYITAVWTVETAGRSETRDVYITLKTKNDRWSVVSIRSASK